MVPPTAGGEDRTVLKGMEIRLFELVAKGATSAQWAEWLRVPLEHAVAKCDKDLALSLLNAGANGGAGWKGCNGRTLLDAAAEGGNKHVVSTLLDIGGLADLNAVSGDEQMTALHRTSKRGHAATARILMVAGADASLLDSRNRSALHYASEDGNLNLIENAVLAGADHNAKDADGDTPLHLAAARDDGRFVSTILRRGATVDVANGKGQHPIHVAVEHDRIPVALALLKAGADPNARYGKFKRCSPLFLARSSLAMTRTLLNYGADVKSSDTLGCTALHWATFNSEVGVIDALVEAGANLETKSSGVCSSNTYYFKGMTPLHTAALWRHQVGGMATLLRKGANINSKDVNGLTPLHVVCKTSTRAKSVEAADLLLRWGADEAATDKDGKIPEELIESDTDLTRRLGRLLTNAPADRAWRRRGMLVLCRAQSTDVLGRTSGGVLSRVVGLEANVLFRTVVRFL